MKNDPREIKNLIGFLLWRDKDMHEEILEIIRKHALINAVTHDGKADGKAVLKKLIAESKEIKTKMQDQEERKRIMQLIKSIVQEINKLTFDEQREVLANEFGLTLADIIEEKSKKTRIGLPPLPDVERFDKIVTRFAPAPSGALHLGQLVRAAFLSYMYARMYDGKFILRIEDTDPKRIKRVYYDWILEDLKAVGIEWDEIVYESDHFDLYYKHARELFEMRKAYVCVCTTEEFQKYKQAKKPCPHRNTMDTVEHWERMLNGDFREGTAVVRLKTDMSHPNPALRDPSLLRIIDTVPHPRTGYKYRVYPLYNYACAIEDHYSGITHVIRGKEHETNEMVQREISKIFGWEPPITIQYGMLRLPELKIHKRHIRAALREGKIRGWEDITLPTIRALLRRGIHPEALRKMSLHVGMTKSDATLSLSTLYAFNRQILSPIAKRLSFVEEPLLVRISGVPSDTFDVKMEWIPGNPNAGHRYYRLYSEKQNGENVLLVYLSSADLELLESSLRNELVVRLKDLMNIAIDRIDKENKIVEARYHSTELIPGISKLHWIPVGDLALNARVLMPDGTIKEGYVEYAAQRLDVGEYIQLERFGFGRIDDNQGEVIVFTFAHP